MLIAKWLWTVDFFFFALILLFLWSKKAIVAKKVKSIEDVFDEIDGLGKRVRPPEASTSETPKKE